jgi:transposase
VRGIVHVNFSESYFSLLQHGIFEAFHHISAQHMQRYFDEFDFRWNRRGMNDFERGAGPAPVAVRGVRGIDDEGGKQAQGRPQRKPSPKAPSRPHHSKPLSLYPLTLEEAVDSLLKVKAHRGPKPKTGTKK